MKPRAKERTPGPGARIRGRPQLAGAIRRTADKEVLIQIPPGTLGEVIRDPVVVVVPGRVAVMAARGIPEAQEVPVEVQVVGLVAEGD